MTRCFNLIKFSTDQRDQKTGLEQLLDHHHVRTFTCWFNYSVKKFSFVIQGGYWENRPGVLS